jgi:DNA-binding NarL/FixJ family response regulator
MLSNQPIHPSQSHPVEAATPQTAKLKILLVDDHAIVRVGLKQMLTDAFAQLEVTEVGTGQDALANVQAASWDLIILDINLPDTNGLDVLKKLKTLRSGLPVVVLSFHPEEQYAVRALKSGASAYVTKDTAPEELATAIKTVLAGRQYVTATLAERLEAMPGVTSAVHDRRRKIRDGNCRGPRFERQNGQHLPDAPAVETAAQDHIRLDPLCADPSSVNRCKLQFQGLRFPCHISNVTSDIGHEAVRSRSLVSASCPRRPFEISVLKSEIVSTGCIPPFQAVQ